MPATVTGGTFGVPGGVAGDPEHGRRASTASANCGRADLDLSDRSAITVEFWLKWDCYTNDDSLAMEFTANFNDNDGGFLVDPNAPQHGGTFGVAHRQRARRATTCSSPGRAPACGTTTRS